MADNDHRPQSAAVTKPPMPDPTARRAAYMRATGGEPVTVSPLDHFPDEITRQCAHCGDLFTNPERCPGWLAHRVRARFWAEGWENAEWTGVVGPQNNLEAAVTQYHNKRRRFPDLPIRLVAELTVHVPLADGAGAEQQVSELLAEGTHNTAALLARTFGQERARAEAAEACVEKLRPLADATRGSLERAQQMERRAIVNGIRADNAEKRIRELEKELEEARAAQIPVPSRDADMTAPVRCVALDCTAVLDLAETWPFGWLAERGPSAKWIHLCPLHSGAWDTPTHRPATGFNPQDRGCACGFRIENAKERNASIDRAYAQHLLPYLNPHPELSAAELAALRKS